MDLLIAVIVLGALVLIIRIDESRNPSKAEIKASQRYRTIKSGRPPLDNYRDDKLNPTKVEVEAWLAERAMMLPRQDDPPKVAERKALWWRSQDEANKGS